MFPLNDIFVVEKYSRTFKLVDMGVGLSMEVGNWPQVKSPAALRTCLMKVSKRQEALFKMKEQSMPGPSSFLPLITAQYSIEF